VPSDRRRRHERAREPRHLRPHRECARGGDPGRAHHHPCRAGPRGQAAARHERSPVRLMESPAPRPQRIETWHAAVQWAVLLVISLLFAGALEIASLPAALLVGPMLAAIIAGTNGATVRVPPLGFAGGQAVVGCLVAGSISPDIFATFLDDWPLVTGVVVATLAASSFLGWFVSGLKILPGTTAVWGSAPGGATAM